MKDKIKILVSYKEEHPYIKSDIIVPIQTGRAIADKCFEGMIGDDTGDNISKKNEKYNELTAQYWAWKNMDKIGNPEYIGFMHWRRQFLFDENLPLPTKTWLNESNYYEFGRFDEEYFKYFRDEKIYEVMKNYDIIVPKVFDFSNHPFKTVKENYEKLPGQHIENYELMINLLKIEYPEYRAAVEKFEKGRFEYLCNMYILRKDIFFEYNEFLFDVLDRLDKIIDYEHYSMSGYRVLGYMGEMLFNIFLYAYVSKHPKVKIKALNVGTLHHAEMNIQPKPVFDKDYTAVVAPCSNYYAPYLSVYLQSLIDNSEETHNYDIVILQDDMSELNKDKLCVGLPSNFSLRFVDVTSYFEDIKLESSKDYLSINSYYRLVVPKVMKNYKRVIVTDIDLIFTNDIAKLDGIEMGQAPIAACIEPQEGINLNMRGEESEYAREILKLEDPYQYYNTGVMVINIEAYSNNDIEMTLQMIDKKYRCHEQCILNAYFNSRILPLPAEWNCELTISEVDSKNYMPYGMYREYMKALKKPYVMHWIGPNKPWKQANVKQGYRWWEIARKTNYYEEIMARYSEILTVRQINSRIKK